jgi:hypothetical protein
MAHVACVLQSCVVMDLDFSPNCMTYRHGFLAAGGICSEVGNDGGYGRHDQHPCMLQHSAV